MLLNITIKNFGLIANITLILIHRYIDYNISKLSCNLFQRYEEIQSLVCHLPQNTLLYDFSRAVIDELIRSPINSSSGIKLSLDKPLNNDLKLNLLRPAVLRQYYGADIGDDDCNKRRYTYGSGTGTSSVGMDPLNFVTRSFDAKMIAMGNDIYDMLHNNRDLFNMNGVDLDERFNHCTILIYYAGNGLKDKTTLGYHTDCVYSPSTFEYISKCNSQKANTPAVIYSIGDTRKLKWKCRCSVKSTTGRRVWEKKECTPMTFQLSSDSLTIIHPDDEYPLSEKNVHDKRQYLHGGVNVSGDKFSVGFVFRVVNSTAMYDSSNDTMVIDTSNVESDVVYGVLGFDVVSFHSNLFNLYSNTLY